MKTDELVKQTEREIPSQMAQMGERISNLWTVIEHLEEALDSIMQRPDTGIEASKDNEQKDLGVPLANDLLSHNMNLANAMERIETIHRRLSI